jgi:dephospho-CoA kinase
MAGYRVGLTGGVASGKSAVADLFAGLGVSVADADIAARAVVEPGQPALADVVAAFGADVLDASGRLDRARLRARVFNDADARRKLEALLHPSIRSALRDAAEAAPGRYVIVAIPLLAEGGGRQAYPWLDRILVVDAPVAIQRTRLMARDGIDAALADLMLAAQADRRQRLAIADDIVVNDGAIEALGPQVEALDRQYRHLAAGIDAR